MFRQIADGSVVDENGKIVFFSGDRFVEDIVDGDRCFICGIDPSAAEFNREHVLPEWILRKYDLYASEIGLPNKAGYTYGRYTIPCCKPCNSRMAELFETPISKLVSEGYQAVRAALQRGAGNWLFVWLALIYLKTHLKDRELRYHLDARKGIESMSDLYAWEELHHIHCMARAFSTDVFIDSNVYGSLLVLPSKTGTLVGDFDYADLHRARRYFFAWARFRSFVC
jgi:hypothetical protein